MPLARFIPLVVLSVLVSLACGPSEMEKFIAERDKQHRLEEEEKKKAEAQEKQSMEEAAKKIPVVRDQIVARAAEVRAAYADGSAEKAAPCKVGSVTESGSKPFLFNHASIMASDRGASAMASAIGEPYSKALLDALGTYKNNDTKEKLDALHLAVVRVSTARYWVVARVTKLKKAQASAAAKIYTPGEITSTAVLFDRAKPVCKVIAEARNADTAKVYEGSNDQSASLQLDEELRVALAKEIATKLIPIIPGVVGLE
jgi:hypothetical protein